MVEFVSYDGSFPNLCSGTLVLKIDGEIVEFSSGILSSGGRVWFDEDWMEHVEHGCWSISSFGGFPKEYRSRISEIEDVVNESIPWGCCGGCVQNK